MNYSKMVVWVWMAGLELIFPSRCPVCDSVLPFGEKICHDCQQKLCYVKTPYCMKCGKPLSKIQQEFCPDCVRNSHSFVRGRALYEYPSVREGIYRFKYQGRKEYAVFFGEELALRLGTEIRRWHADAIVPVPLHRRRRKKRGYNQAELLARKMGDILSIPVKTNLVKRVKNTKAQKNLGQAQRQNNLKNAFKIVGNDVKLDTIILIDDIYTTGSTVDALAEVFYLAGVHKVYFIALAIGRG